MNISKNNRLLQMYRWFKRRAAAVSSNHLLGKIEGYSKHLNEAKRLTEPGAHIDVCRMIRMDFLWGPFLVIPAWVLRFIALPVVVFTAGYFALALFGNENLGAFFPNLPTIGGGITEWLLWSPLYTLTSIIMVIIGIAFLFIFVMILARILEYLETSFNSVAPIKTPVFKIWLQGLKEKFCPVLTVE